MAKLLITLPDRGYITHELSGEQIAVGRLSANAIQIDDASVSGHHAQFALVNGRYRLRDLSSMNKTWVNGAPVSDAELTGSSILRFGTVEAVFQPDAGPQTADQLMLQLAESRRQVEKLKQARDAIHAQMQRSLGDLDEAKAVRDEAASELETLRVELQARREQTSASDREISRLVTENDAARETSANLASDLAAARDDMDVIQREIGPLRAKASEAPAELDALRQTLAEKEAEAGAARQKCEASQQDAEKASQELAQARQRVTELEQQSADAEVIREQAETLRGELSNRDAEFLAERQRLEAAAAERDAARSEMAAALVRADALDQQAAQAAQEAASLREQLAARQAEIDSAREQGERLASESAEAASAHEQQIVALSRHLEELHEESEAARQLGEQAAVERDAAVARADSLEARAADAETFAQKLEELRAQLMARDAEIAAASAERDAAVARADSLETRAADAETFAQQLEEIRAQLMARDAEVAAASAERDALQVVLGETGAQHAELEARARDHDETRARLETLQGEVIAVREELAAALASPRAQNWLGDPTPALEPPRPGSSLFEPMDAVVLPERPEEEAAALIAEAPLLSSWLKRGTKKRLQQPNGHSGASVEEAPAEVRAPLEKNASGSSPADDDHSVSEVAVAAPSDDALPPAPPPASQAPLAMRIDAGALASVPGILGKMRSALRYFVRHPEDTASMGEVAVHASCLSAQTQLAGYRVVHETSAALELLVRDLVARPKRMNSSVLRTASQTLDFVTVLLEEKNLARSLDLPPAKIFTVDDDPAIREMIIAAMRMVHLDAVGSGESKASLSTLTTEKVDLILLDVGMPEMNGLDLCTQLRAIPAHRKTPIVFITGMATAQNRVQSTLRGGNDFISKPFQVCELGLKALTWAYKGQLDLVA